MTLHKEGRATIIISLLLFFVINGLAWWGLPKQVAQIVTVLTLVPLCIAINFFRRPVRHKVKKEGYIISPCDGTVVTIEETYEPEVLKRDVLQVSIFMSVLNVHINWFPVGGLVEYYRHHDGKKMAAYLPKSSTNNERSSILIKTKSGKEVLVRQVAGAMARRVVTYAKEGQMVSQSEEMGFIKFGSRVDLYLPIGTNIDVKLKDKVTGSQTVIGWLE
ncbi:MAG: phosphatidylserine decarboxylase family protein [Bacteroidales bacterium]|nr:phosphatidylserine decarboxylase family protein [Bacteroidales bacterium]MDY4175818.1 phosphatidylserine decarboxylase family protein [Bacteroidales bacterium]